MKRLFLLALLASCQSSGTRGAVGEDGETAMAAAVSPDSARRDSLLSVADGARILGDSSAPVWIVEVSDFQCPFCRQWHEQTYPALVRDYVRTGVVRLAYLNLPLQQHQHAQHAAEVAMCAAVQNRFWPMHDALFGTQRQWADLSTEAAAAKFDSLAAGVVVDQTAWRDCMRRSMMERLINGDRQRAASVGVRSTPTFFIGDEVIQGAQPLSVFRGAIERARAKAAGRPNSG